MTASTTGGSCLTAKGLDISLAALQRQDPYINNIVDVASQVALYTFNSKTNEWEKTDVEGTLFVYTRLASPRHGFTIMNRLSMENLTEPITKDLDFQLQDPFLLYRNARLSIHGIWFYDKTDCQRIADLMKNLTRQEHQLHQQQKCGWVSPRALDTSQARGVDILQMLTKARSEYDKGKVSSEPLEIGGGGGVIHDNPHLVKPIPLKPSERQRMLQHQDGDSKPVSLVSLFGSQPPPSFPQPHHQQPPHTGPPVQQPHTGPPVQQPHTGPPVQQQQPHTGPPVQQPHTGPPAQSHQQQPHTGGGSGRPGAGGRPAVARSLSYDDPSAQAVPVSPGGGPLMGAPPPTPPLVLQRCGRGAPALPCHPDADERPAGGARDAAAR
ncbi:mRNA-decapping enzyme 1B isoform X1 [Alosa sapidissima]|uniref:mRNA-decapping enzyme 1B isoform X1 n=1 Tax=Alosa sapidissima TaxID=34773 RepID=UPI001C092D5D|nr:mRNA-decapping enzyme 1B isoform X1 [Alosa sapidissima]